MKCTAIILAAGQGKRMKSNVQKQFLQLGEYPVLYYSLKAFQDSPEITDIVLVCGKTEINYCKDAFVQKYHIDKVSEVVAGGKERYESVYQGLCACHKTDYVLIHDGARPFVTEELIQRYGSPHLQNALRLFQCQKHPHKALHISPDDRHPVCKCLCLQLLQKWSIPQIQ